jgi:hypothetical protein
LLQVGNPSIKTPDTATILVQNRECGAAVCLRILEEWGCARRTDKW